jgi:hypothetical protein
MEMHDNPSAGKFDPPSGHERFEAPKPRRTLQWSALLFTFVLLIARVALDHIHTTGRTAYLVGAGLVGIFLADFIRAKRGRDKHEDANRPDVHTITPR